MTKEVAVGAVIRDIQITVQEDIVVIDMTIIMEIIDQGLQLIMDSNRDTIDMIIGICIGAMRVIMEIGLIGIWTVAEALKGAEVTE